MDTKLFQMQKLKTKFNNNLIQSDMKIILKKRLWITVIAIPCLVLVTLLAVSSCDKTETLPKHCTITFVGEEVDIAPQSITYGNYATAPENPEREGYDFVGWFTDNGTFTDEWNFEANIVTQDTTLYAEWEENASQETISGTWKVKTIRMSGELKNIGLPPDDAHYSNILIEIPDKEQGYMEGNTFDNKIEFEFEKNEYRQIYIHNDRQYIENELLIRLNSGVDATEFAANSEQGIAPKHLLSERLNIWLFETDGTTPLRIIISNLSQHPDVNIVSYNNAGITIREEVNHFIENMRNTAKFEISNNELKFLDSQNNIVIVFINHLIGN